MPIIIVGFSIMPSDNPSLTTAYVSNTRQYTPKRVVAYEHNESIKSLLSRDYSFLPVSYQNSGYLFRGLACGLNAACETGNFSLNQGEHALAHLERELGVILVSADFSDAYSVSQFWDSMDDAVIVMIAADYFADRYRQHQAATLGFAEPGVVFKYPFLYQDIPLVDVDYFIVGAKAAAKLRAAVSIANGVASKTIEGKLIVVEDECRNLSRSALAAQLEQSILDKGITPAQPVQVQDYPTVA